MTGLGGADEVVEAVAAEIKGTEELGGVAVAPFQRGHIMLSRAGHHFVGVLIGPGQKEDAAARSAGQGVKPCEAIGHAGGVTVPDVGSIVDVIDRGGDVHGLGARGGGGAGHGEWVKFTRCWEEFVEK